MQCQVKSGKETQPETEKEEAEEAAAPSSMAELYALRHKYIVTAKQVLLALFTLVSLVISSTAVINNCFDLFVDIISTMDGMWGWVQLYRNVSSGSNCQYKHKHTLE